MNPSPLGSASDGLINRLIRYPRSVASRLRISRLRFLGASIGTNCWLRTVCIPRNPWDIELGVGVALDDGVVLLATGDRSSAPRIRIRSGTYVNRYTIFDASEDITVGCDCMIGPLCYITDHDHGYSPTSKVSSQALISERVTIGDDVWIGAGVVILKGVSIGDGAVIGAGATITKDVPQGAVFAGEAARQIGLRSGSR